LGAASPRINDQTFDFEPTGVIESATTAKTIRALKNAS